MGQLGAAARCPFAKVTLLEQKHVVAAAGRVDGYANAGGAATDHNNVPGFGVCAKLAPHLVASHIKKLENTRINPDSLKLFPPI